jgi:predicted CXXCH cytochrome family protein
MLGKVIFVILFLSLLSGSMLSQDYTVDDAPDALSPSHSETPGLKNCMKCHTPELEVDAAKCLSCHQEIALRIEEQRGFHREFAEGCADCHAEHEGASTKLIDMDPDDFDHAETGIELKGVHEQIKDCRACHRADNTLPRRHSISYLFSRSGCQACHDVPHPGRQDQCSACHIQTSWRVDVWRKRGVK